MAAKVTAAAADYATRARGVLHLPAARHWPRHLSGGADGPRGSRYPPRLPVVRPQFFGIGTNLSASSNNALLPPETVDAPAGGVRRIPLRRYPPGKKARPGG